MSNDPTVIIVGAGITGIGAAYHLARRNIPYVVLEASGDVGGIWSSQRWHGCRCDSDIIKYSYSFKPLLSETSLKERADIHTYLRDVVRAFGITERIRFNTSVRSAAFDTRASQWTVETTRGTFRSQFLINGNGYFAAEPYAPRFPGMGRFAGEIVHTTHLNDRRTFHDKDVVLVGSGATAICCAPVLASVSRSLTLLQRSPSYIYEIDNSITPAVRIAQALHRRGITTPLSVMRWVLQARDDVIFVLFRRFPALARRVFRTHWRSAVGDDALRRHFTPRYQPWEQRIPVAIGLKESLRTGRVVMQTGDIDHFTETEVILSDGRALHCDVCVLATGFELQFFKFPISVDGTLVSTDRINFFKGIMMGGIPNYFQPVGVLHSAWTQRSEHSTRYAIRVMEFMRERRLSRVQVERRAVDTTPTITPNYITRHPEAPRVYGSFELPTLDNLLRYRFRPRDFRFE